MIEIVQAQSDKDIREANELTLEYLNWCVEESRNRLNEELDIDELYNHSISDQDSFMSDSGRLLLAKEGETVAGIAFLKRLREDVCEIKRMYVQPQYRGKKIGELLLSKLIEEAKVIGYSRVFLDSDPYMDKAHSLYKAMGFAEIPPYPEAEMDGDDYSQHMIYMELVL